MKFLCPICRKPTDSESDADFPFCGERCRLMDLGNWSSEKYKVSSPIMDESEIEESSQNERSAERPGQHSSRPQQDENSQQDD